MEKDIYQEIWKKAKSYYQKGRPFDIAHIKWMMKDAEYICEQEVIDKTILLPLVILHDVGYAEVDTTQNSYNLDLRKAHMKAGAEIASHILTEFKYPQDKTKTIVDYVAIHDNWAFEENKRYTKDKMLGTFNDLDFMWLAVEEGFNSAMKMTKKNPQEMFEYVKQNDKLIKRPFSTKTAKELFDKYIKQREDSIKAG